MGLFMKLFQQIPEQNGTLIGLKKWLKNYGQ
jgi:hypothetical protein